MNLSTFRWVKPIFFKKYPVHFTYFVTSRCNMGCKMCFYWKNIDKTKKPKELAIEEIEKLSKTMKNFLWLLISGGEPFLREDLDEICEIFSRNNKVTNISIPTNGYLSDKIFNVTEMIVTKCPNTYISVSLSFHDTYDNHDKITGKKGSFNRLLKTYKKLDILRKDFKNLGIGAIIIQSKYNEKNLENLLNFILNKLDVDNISFGLTRGSPRDITSKETNIAYYKKMCNLLSGAISKNKLRTFNIKMGDIILAKDRVLNKVVLNTIKENRYQIPCYAANLSCVMDGVGNIYACELLSKKLGNIKDYNYDFGKLWLSKKAKYLRKYIKKSKCYCIHGCNLTTNIISGKRQLPKLAKEWINLKLKISQFKQRNSTN